MLRADHPKLAPVALFAPAQRTVQTMLTQQAKRYGARTLFVCGSARWSYEETRHVAAANAGLLASAGVARGDRVAILCGNRPELMRLFLGCAWLGAVSVPLNAAARGLQLQHMLGNSGAKILAIESDLLDALATVDLSALPLQRIWIIGGAGQGGAPAFKSIIVEALPAATIEVPAADVGPGDLLTILYTSGTTGLSKGVCCPHAQYFWWGAWTGWQLGVREGDVLHTPLPLFHTNALNCFFQALLHGATQVVEQRFSVSGFWPALAQSGATVTYLLGAMVPMLMSRPPSAAERGHKVRVALAPGVPANYHAPFTERTGVIPLDGFGSTESNIIIASFENDRKPGTMGRLLPAFDARIVDDNDNEVPDGEAGELILRADEPFAFATGYFGMPEKTVEAWRNLWLHTGDRVIRDADGFLPLRRPHEGCDPPARREHILVRSGAGADQPSGGGDGGGVSGGLGPGRGRGDGRHRLEGRRPRQRRRVNPFLRRQDVLFCHSALYRVGGDAAAHRKRQGAEVQVAPKRP